MKRIEILLGLVIGVCGSLIANVMWQLLNKLYSRLKNISFIQFSERFFAILSAQKLPTRILPTTFAFVIAFFFLVNISPQSVIAPSGDSREAITLKAPKKGATSIVTYIDSLPPPSAKLTKPCSRENEPSLSNDEPSGDPEHDRLVKLINSLPTGTCYTVDNSP
jgi:hypothetical protein